MPSIDVDIAINGCGGMNMVHVSGGSQGGIFYWTLLQEKERDTVFKVINAKF